MKRPLFALALALTAMTMPAIAPVEAAYFGAVQGAAGYALEVVTLSQVAVTTLVITHRGALVVQSIEKFDGTSGTSPALVVVTIPNKASRVILLVDALPGESAKVKVTAGGQVFEVHAEPSTRIQFDVI